MTYRQRYNFVEQHHGRHMKIEYEILEKNKTKKKNDLSVIMVTLRGVR